ncbi:MAG TPA: hypothetical protein VHA37_01855 [Candidatus Saccharimonadales bacterium]|nr:hypothetical protein [Candidatus Saccharimonadales bacterium]
MLDQVITIRDVLAVAGIVLGGIVVIGAAAWVLSIYADAWRH